MITEQLAAIFTIVIVICTVVGAVTAIITVRAARKFTPVELHTRIKENEDCLTDHERRLTDVEKDLKVEVKGLREEMQCGMKDLGNKLDTLIMTMLGNKL